MVPPWVMFPNTDAGNDGLCRFNQSLELMPNDAKPEATLTQSQPLAECMSPSYNFVYECMGTFSLPVLVVAGSQDWGLPLSNSFALVERIPGASLLQFPDAGHGVLLQHDHASASLISAWLGADMGSYKQNESSSSQCADSADQCIFH